MLTPVQPFSNTDSVIQCEILIALQPLSQLYIHRGLTDLTVFRDDWLTAFHQDIVEIEITILILDELLQFSFTVTSIRDVIIVILQTINLLVTESNE